MLLQPKFTLVRPFTYAARATSIILTAAILVACGGGGGSGSTPSPIITAPPPPPPTPLKLETKAETTSFLSKATFGASDAQVTSAMDKNASDLLNAEFNKTRTYYLPVLKSKLESGEEVGNREAGAAFWDALVDSDDQLRQRMVFALSQIVVVSDKALGGQPLSTAQFMDVLSENAFGNYRDLLKEVTYTPAMARFLTYLRNRKGKESTGRMPDENYAREFLQLFTIGLVELNMDGTPKLDANGKPIELFDNEDIIGLAKVFTGLTEKGSTFWKSDEDGHYSKMVMFEDEHSPLEKTFLGKTIPAETAGDASIDQAIDHIFDHSNVAPFVSRQLIQRFTASHPAPAYVQRVAEAFEAGRFTSADNVQFGTGVRGDLKATLAAILLDEQFYDDVEATPQEGKIREPVLRFAHWARAFDVSNVLANNEWWLLYDAGKNTRLGQQPFSAPSVFNFYRPGYVAPGTETGKQNLNAPEFQIVNEGSVIGFDNFMLEFVYNTSSRKDKEFDSYVPDYTDEVTLADDPEKLADHLNDLLLGGRMSTQTRERMVTVLNEIPIREDHVDEDKITRAAIAVYMAVISPAFAIEV